MAVALVFGLVGAAVSAQAEVERLEVAVLAVDDAGNPRPRAQLVEEAIEVAVARVASALTEPGAAPPASDTKGWLSLLGSPASTFAVRMRELQAADPPAGIEISRIAVEIDAARVRDALGARGLPLVERQRPTEEEFRIRLDVGDWATLERLEQALALRWSARSVPERLVPGRAWLRVSTAGGPEALVERIAADPAEDLQVVPLGLEDGVLLLDVSRVGAPPEGGAFDTAE